MISKAQIKLIHSLTQKKYRKTHRLFIAEGAKIADELIHSAISVHKVYALKDWLVRNEPILRVQPEMEITEVDERELKQISLLTTPQEVLLLAEIPEEGSMSFPIGEKLSLALESIRDPGNMGTIIRLADWYGLEHLFCSEDCTDPYSPKVVQASMGSIGRVKIHSCSLKELFTMAGADVYAATLDGRINIHNLQNYNSALLLIGNESEGVSRELLQHVQHTIAIPRFGQAESLNAAIATGILLDNFRRIAEQK